MKEKLLISKCLLGINCKYNGGNNLISKLDLLKEKYDLYPVCPEMDGGLPCPRHPCEINNDNNKIISDINVDCTNEYSLGAQKALKICQTNQITKALLKEKSPSCGTKKVYDGSFNHILINGKGVTAKLLSKHGIILYNENEIEKLLK